MKDQKERKGTEKEGKEEKEDATEPDAVITGVGKLINPQGLRNMKWAPGISVHSLILFKTIHPL